MTHITEPLERQVAEALDKAGIIYTHESEEPNQILDFHLLDFDVSIEVKQYHSERISNQMKSKDNVIALQGRKAVELFCSLLKEKV